MSSKIHDEWSQFRERLLDHLTWCDYQDFDKVAAGAILLQLFRIENDLGYEEKT